MLIVLNDNVREEEISMLAGLLAENNLDFRQVTFYKEKLFILFNNKGMPLYDMISSFGFVKKIMDIKEPYKLSSRKYKPENSRFVVGNVVIGGVEPVIISGPCSVESEKQIWRLLLKLHQEEHIYCAAVFTNRVQARILFRGWELKRLNGLAARESIIKCL